MSERDLDEAVSRCAAEPIHVPGSIQPHGVLLAARGSDRRVVRVSANCADLLGLTPEQTLGRRLGELLTLPSSDELDGDRYDVNPWPVTLAGRECDAVFHWSDGLLVVEVEPANDRSPLWYARVPSALQRLQDAGTPADFGAALVAETRRITGFDRVMAYRFDPEWNGEVVAEARRDDLEPFLDLRYPASDIPAQARALYLRNWLRLIGDVDYTPVPLLADPDEGDSPLDLSLSTLRSVSPVHLAYLRNMGVAASMSASLVVEGRLWGLVACHHYAGPLQPSVRVRAATEFLARVASALIPALGAQARYAMATAAAASATSLSRSLARPGRTVAAALTSDETTLLDLVPAGGAAIRLGGSLELLGETPDAAAVSTLLDALWPDDDRQPVVTDALPTVLPEATPYAGVASGLLAVPLAASRDAAIAWFRPEVVREVTWGGDPTTPKLTTTETGVQLTPRSSFEAWRELVRGHSTAWEPHHLDAAQQLARDVGDAVLTQRERADRVAAALARTLLGESLPTLPGLQVGASYLPSANDVVGGDWYDLMLLPNRHVAAVVGDVAGHGLGMSAVTAQLRNALRAHLLRELDPALALSRLNDLAAWLLPSEMATAVVVDLDTATGRARIASAGHLPPLLRRSTGSALLDVERGPALGLIRDARHGSSVVDLDPDDVLVMFTDGLVERRTADLDERLAELAGAATRLIGSPQQMCDGLVAAMGARDGEDDVTVLAVRHAPGAA